MNYQISKTFEQSAFIFGKYAHILERPADFSDFKEPFGLVFPKLDFFISVQSVAQGVNFIEFINRNFRGGLRNYLLKALDWGYIGRFGASVDPNQYMLNFENNNLTLLWIPKNSCTTLKRTFLTKEDPKRVEKVIMPLFHENCQRQFGVSKADFVQGKTMAISAVIREPYGRIVSCYLDKFANPVIKNTDFEDFIPGHIKAAQYILGIPHDPRRSLTFEEFVSYIWHRPRWALDSHWRPQTDFLPSDNVVANLGLVENLGAFLKKADFEGQQKSYNTSFGGRVETATNGAYGNVLPSDLGSADLKNYGEFLSHNACVKLDIFLEDDISLYNMVSAADQH